PCASSSTSAQVSVSGSSTSPKTRKSQPARSRGYEGTSPTWSTGHFSVRYWPGGRRAGAYPASRTFRSALLRNTLATLEVDVRDDVTGRTASQGVRLRDRA